MSKPIDDNEDVDEIDADYDPEAEVTGNWKKVDLPEIPVVTGEEDDEVISKFRSKIYRWRKEWKERGVGELKFLKSKHSGKIRILMRADKTHKLVANHLLQKEGPLGKLESLKTSNNSWTWSTYDISDDKPHFEKLCAKFTSKEQYERFEIEFNKACEANSSLFAKKEQKKEEVVEKKQEVLVTVPAQPEKKQ